MPILFEDYRNDMDDTHKVICVRAVSVQTQDDIPQAKLLKVISDFFAKKKISFDTHNVDVMFEDIQGCMDTFVDLKTNLLLPFYLMMFFELKTQDNRGHQL